MNCAVEFIRLSHSMSQRKACFLTSSAPLKPSRDDISTVSSWLIRSFGISPILLSSSYKKQKRKFLKTFIPDKQVLLSAVPHPN